MPMTLDELIDSVQQLVSLPDVYHRVEQALSDPSKSLEDVGKVLETDPDLSARLLAIANSAMYRRAAPVESVGRALTTIGSRELRDLVLATVVARLFSRLPLGSVNMLTFWRHSLACAVTARMLAVARREGEVERFYVIGLLHDIGRLLLFLREPTVMYDALIRRQAEGGLLYQVERELLGYDHAQAGAALLKSWDIPERLHAPIGFHHDPMAAGGYTLEASVIHVSDVIVGCLELGSSGQRVVPPLLDAAWREVDLPENSLAEITSRVDAQVKELSALMFH